MLESARSQVCFRSLLCPIRWRLTCAFLVTLELVAQLCFRFCFCLFIFVFDSRIGGAFNVRGRNACAGSSFGILLLFERSKSQELAFYLPIFYLSFPTSEGQTSKIAKRMVLRNRLFFFVSSSAPFYPPRARCFSLGGYICFRRGTIPKFGHCSSHLVEVWSWLLPFRLEGWTDSSLGHFIFYCVITPPLLFPHSLPRSRMIFPFLPDSIPLVGVRVLVAWLHLSA